LLVLTFTLVGELFSLKERAKAAGLTSSVWALASIVGPPLGGLIVDSVGWRWIFYINLPVGGFLRRYSAARTFQRQERG
jgi:MFS family permease